MKPGPNYMTTTILRLSAATLLAGSACLAIAEEPSVDQVCAQAYCRTPATVSVRLDKDTAMDYEIEGIPVAFMRDVNLFPGESIELSVTIENGEIQSLHYDPSIQPEGQTISIRFSQNESEPFGMMLVIENSFDKFLRYEAFIAVPNREGFGYTSSCPVGPGISAYESWQEPISHIVLTNIRFIEIAAKGDSFEITCE